MNQDSNDYWEQLERLEKLIRASEFKAGAIFSFHGLILGLFFDRFDQISFIFTEGNIYIVLVLLWFISSLISVFFCFICFKPQIELKYDRNVFFYKDAANSFGGVKGYTEELLKVFENKKDLFELLAGQIHAESKIIEHKFLNVHKAIVFFGISVSFVLIIAGVYIIQSFF